MKERLSASRKDMQILIIGTGSFNWITGAGVTLSNLFKDFPAQQLAALHQDQIEPDLNICHEQRRIAPEDFHHVWYIQILRAPFVLLRRLFSGPLKSPIIANLFNIDSYLSGLFGGSIPSRANISEDLRVWLDKIRPDLIYTFLGSNEVMSMSRLISKEKGIPVAIHFMDDWPQTVYRRSCVEFFEYMHMKFMLSWFLKNASVRMTICHEMSEVYETRYGYKFINFQNNIDTRTWSKYRHDHSKSDDLIEIVYVGSIYSQAQSESLLDACRAVSALVSERHRVTLKVFSHKTFTAPLQKEFAACQGVQLFPELDDNVKFFETLASASILLLPVNFDQESINRIKLSMPTKVPAMLNSGTPILAYGPDTVAQIKYASREGWALVVSEKNIDTLKNAILHIANEKSLRRDLSANALRCVHANHDAAVVREDFRSSLYAGVSNAADESQRGAG